MKKIILLVLVVVTGILNGFAQTTERKEFLYSNKFSILAGLIQPTVLSGGNLEINYTTKRLIFDYSHGFSLDPPATGDVKDQNLVLHLPSSTGFGVGYRITSFLDIRFEPKLHSWEAYYKSENQTESSKIKDFKTMTLGIGLYYRYFPFKNSDNKFLQGITTSTSIRWWQNVGTTLRDDQFSYSNKTTGKTETLKAPSVGLANTPLIINIGIGYTFGGKN
jgi:hypothetical protein